MPEAKNRRAESEARGLLKRTETIVGRASTRLLDGDTLAAMRLLRIAEQLNALDSRLRSRRAMDQSKAAFTENQAIEKRERACTMREAALYETQRKLEAQANELHKTEKVLAAAYKLMREGNVDGPAPATHQEVDSGVAPL